MIDFNCINSIRESGFFGFKKVSDLLANTASIPDAIGVYMILYMGENPCEFVENGTGGFFKERDPNVGLSVLREKWVNKTKVIYIGKAGSLEGQATLRSRF